MIQTGGAKNWGFDIFRGSKTNALRTFSFQITNGTRQEEKHCSKFRGERAEGLQGAGLGFLHVRPVLGAVLHPEHTLRSVSGLRSAQPRGRGLSLAWIRQFYNQSNHLHDLQQDFQGGFHTSPAVQVSQVTTVIIRTLSLYICILR